MPIHNVPQFGDGVKAIRNPRQIPEDVTSIGLDKQLTDSAHELKLHGHLLFMLYGNEYVLVGISKQIAAVQNLTMLYSVGNKRVMYNKNHYPGCICISNNINNIKIYTQGEMDILKEFAVNTPELHGEIYMFYNVDNLDTLIVI